MILITRPKFEALALEEKLKQFGIASHVDPIISFSEVDNLFLKEYDQNFVCIFSSIRAVHFIERKYQDFKNIFKKVKIVCIGKKVQSELNNKSLNVIATFSDANDLLENFSFNDFQEIKFCYFCSETFNRDFVDRIKKKVNQFELVNVYKTIAASDFNQTTKELIKSCEINGYMVYSRFSAKILIQILEKNSLLHLALQQKVFCLSESIQSIMIQNGFKNLYSGTSPNEASLLNVVKKAH